MEEQNDQKVDKGFTITKLEIIRFTMFTLIFFIIIFLQMRVSIRFISNQNIQDHFFDNSTNIFSQNYIGRLESFEWIDQQLYRAYNLNSKLLGSTYKEIIPISKLRITSTMIKEDPLTGLWDTNMTPEHKNKGTSLQYKYNSSQSIGLIIIKDGYQLYFLPYSVGQYKKQSMGYDLNTDFEYNDLKLIERGFLNSQTNSVKIDAAFYNGNINFVAVIQIQIVYSPQGQVQGVFQVNTYIGDAYLTSLDTFRMIMELLFLVIYCNLCVLEVFKIKAQITKAFDDNTKLEGIAQRKKEKAEEKQQARNERNLLSPQSPVVELENQGQGNKNLIQNQNVNEALKHLEEIQKQMEEKINKIKKNVKLVALGLQRHISDLWSALDVAALIIIAIAIMDWTNAYVSSDINQYFANLLSKSSDINGYFLAPGIDSANQLCIDQTTRTLRYRKLISISGLIMTTKLIKFFVFIFPDFQPYQIIMIRVFQYMVSFMIILITMILAITEFVYFYYGSNVKEFSNFYGALNYVFGMILGVNDNIDGPFEYDQTLSFFVQLLFYLLITCVMLNMFYVFVIFEQGLYEQQVEEKQEKARIEQTKVHNNELNQKHPIWFFYEASEYLFLQFWFTFICKRQKFTEFQHNKSQKERIYEREFIVNIQNVDYDTNFQKKTENQHGKPDISTQTKLNQKFLLEDEKLQGMRKERVELVQLIWRTFILLILLLLNFLLVQQFYSPQEAYQQSISLQDKIRFGGQTQDQASIKFNQINKQSQITDWIINTFPLLFDQILLSKREVQSLSGSPDPYNKNTSLTPEQQLEAFMYDNYQFESLSVGTSLNFFNLVVNNDVRVTIRKSNTIDNPDQRFRKIYPTLKTFFPLNPQDQPQSANERKDPFKFMDGQTPLSELHYNPDMGWADSGGYSMVMQTGSVGKTIKNLNNLNFFDSTTASYTMEFVTINPFNKGCLAYVVIYFVLNQAGIVDNFGIEAKTIKQSQIETLEEISIIILTVALFVYLCYQFKKTLKTLRTKNQAYIKWYKTYITLVLSKAQIHFRHRKTPEFIRKWLFLMDVSQLLSFVYLALMGFEIGLIILSFIQVNSLVEGSSLFGQPVQKLFNLIIITFGPPTDYLATAYQITMISGIISIIASLAILVLCIEMLYLLSNNQEFQVLTKSLVYTLSHLPYVLVILLFFVTSFSLMGYFLLGSKNRDFCTFYGASIKITSYIFYVDSLSIFRSVNNATDFFLLALPCVITARFIIVNLFFAILYRGYYITKKAISDEKLSVQATNHKEDGLTVKEFLYLSWEMFNHKDKLPQPQSVLYLLQIIKQFQVKRVYSQIRENIRIQINMANILIWSQKCGSDIKDEAEIRESLDKATDEILEAYIELNNQGDFQILEKLNLEPERKVVEYGLQTTYIEYFRQSMTQFDKFTSYFDHRISFIQSQMYGHLSQYGSKTNAENDNQFLLILIDKYEENFEENLNSLQYIRQQVEAMGLADALQIDYEQQQNKEKHDKLPLSLRIDCETNQNFQENSALQQQTARPKGNMKNGPKPLTFNRKNIGIKFQDEEVSTTEKSGGPYFITPQI